MRKDRVASQAADRCPNCSEVNATCTSIGERIGLVGDKICPAWPLNPAHEVLSLGSKNIALNQCEQQVAEPILVRGLAADNVSDDFPFAVAHLTAGGIGQ